MADLVGEAGHVHAFEPNPPIAERLRQSCYVNGFFFNVTVHEQALDDADGKVLNLVIPDGEPKNAHTLPEGAVTEGLQARPVIARRLGLSTRSSTNLWRDRALVELNVAVLHSFKAAGVRMVDHHSAAEQFMTHLDRERGHGRDTPGDWSWLVPPMSGATTPVFHRY